MNQVTKKDTPVAKLFTKGDHYYLYDTYSNHVLEISKGQYVEISELLTQGVINYLENAKQTKNYEDVLLLLYRGYLHTPWIKDIEHPETKFAENILFRGMQHLTLQVTQDCNFKCRYCHYTRDTDIERAHNKKYMSWEMAKKSIDFFWEHSKDSSKISFGFYGGEPLMNFSLICQCVEYIEERFETKNISYNITTNGSLFSDKIIDFLANKEFIVSVSLDGPPHVQNYNRKYYENGQDTFKHVWNNVQRMKELHSDWFNENVYFHPVYLAHESITDILVFFEKNSIESNKVLLNSANLDGIDYFLANRYNQSNIVNSPETLGAKLRLEYDKQMSNNSIIPNVWHHNGPCVPGGRKLFVDLNGAIFPCEKLNSSTANSIGKIDTGINFEAVEKILNIGKMTDFQCKNCFAMRFCNICVQKCYNPEKKSIDLEQKQLHCEKIRKNTVKYLKQYVSEKGSDEI